MKVQGIEEITKKDIPLYYRNEYAGTCNLEVMGDVMTLPVQFSVEIKPTGERVVDVRIEQKIDYPLLPVIKALKEKIITMEKDGDLR